MESVADVVRRGRLRWFGHLERKDSGVQFDADLFVTDLMFADDRG